MNAAQSAQRYFALTESEDLTIDLVFNYLDGDIKGTEADYKLYRFTGAASNQITSTLTASANTMSAEGITDFSTDWAVGNVFATNTAPTIAAATGAPNFQFLHLFFVNASCSPADTFACLTPGGSLQILASNYDPLTTGYLIAVAVDEQGRPTENNNFIGSAFVRDDVNGVIDSYGAEAFWKLTPGAVTPGAGGSAALLFDGVNYEAVGVQFAVQIQDPNRSKQTVVLASMSGDLGTMLNATGQSAVGTLYRADEAPASFQPSLGSGCLLLRAVTNQNFRVVPGPLTNFLKDRYGYLRFNVTTPSVGLLLTRQGAANQAQRRFAGIHDLHQTAANAATLLLPVFPPFCG
jgi:hypothetical protein